VEKVGEYIKFERKDKWSILLLNNPPANSLSISLMDQLNDKLIQIEGDEGIRAVIITGNGKFFAAGGDINELEKVNTQSEGIELSKHIHSIFNKIETFSKAIIAAINGPCLGGGLELALACHMRVADEGAQLGLPEIKLGLIPGGGGTQRLPRIVGRAKAYEMILTGDTIDAREAFRIGLINSIAPNGKCLEYAESYVNKISQKASTAIAYAMEAILATEQKDLAIGLEKEAHCFSRLCETPEKKEGIRTFLKGKKGER
jgi:enoyl-CoA hydratase/carnithine racemase